MPGLDSEFIAPTYPEHRILFCLGIGLQYSSMAASGIDTADAQNARPQNHERLGGKTSFRQTLIETKKTIHCWTRRAGR